MNIEEVLLLAQGLILDPSGFVKFPGTNSARGVYSIGAIPGLRRFTSCHRYEPFWMNSKAGTSVADVAVETQYMLAQLADEQYLLLVPMVDGVVRASLQGSPEGLELVAETGEANLEIPDFVGLFVAIGANPYQLLEDSAKTVNRQVGIGRLRTEKAVPAFTDRFGWCTWDAFYTEVSEEKVRTGLQTFKDGGVEPRYLILDDGWLSTSEDKEDNSKRLTAFKANEKFPGGLAATVQMAKGEFQITEVIAWHAMTGYWGGVDPACPGYGAEIKPRVSSPGIFSHVGDIIWWGKHIGLVPSSEIYRFFHDWHRELRAQGIDGVKVDVQAQLEFVSDGAGGRVDLMKRYHEALEGSVQVHFQGNLINCMSCANEMLYGAPTSNLTRTSTDFWPDKPESHGLHLYVNSQVSAWFGEFIHPDWDMFQSGHKAGAFHAAGRAVSGGPVYVSDKPQAQNFDVLRTLVLDDGSILRASRPGRPTRDCLMHNPTTEDILLKIFNVTPCGGILGVFNARYGGPDSLSGAIRPSDIEGIVGDTFVAYAFGTDEVRILDYREEWSVSLPELGSEVFTLSPIHGGVAPIGLAGKLNGGGAISSRGDDHFTVGHPGKYLLYSSQQPDSMSVNGEAVDFEYDESTGIASLKVESGPSTVQVKFR